MFKQVVVPLIVLILTGVTIIAYKHPKGYKNFLQIYGIIPIGVLTIIISIKIGGLLSSVQSLSEELKNNPTKTLNAVEHLIDSAVFNFGSAIIYFFILLGIILYGGFLLTLPLMLEDDKENNSKD